MSNQKAPEGVETWELGYLLSYVIFDNMRDLIAEFKNPEHAAYALHAAQLLAKVERERDELIHDVSALLRSASEEATERNTLQADNERLRNALADLLTKNPAFRSKPLGAPNSPVRLIQEAAIHAEDAARAALREPQP